MNTAKFKYWEEDGWYIGHFLDYPDYWTQGESLDDLKEHLRDLYSDIVDLQLQRISRKAAKAQSKLTRRGGLGALA